MNFVSEVAGDLPAQAVFHLSFVRECRISQHSDFVFAGIAPTAMMAEIAFLPESDVRALIARAQRGDHVAFAAVVEQVRPFIFKLARQFSRQYGGVPVEDLVQTGLLAAVKSVPCFDPDAGVKFVSYVGVAARRAIHRVATNWKCLPQAGGEEDFIGELPDCRGQEALSVSDVDMAGHIRSLVASHLGEREQHLVKRRFGLDGTPPLTYAELAVVTGTSRQNVQQVVERALRRLRTAMSDMINA